MKKFRHIAIVIESEDELQQLHAILNFTPLRQSSPLLDKIYKTLGCINYRGAYLDRIAATLKSVYHARPV